MYNHIKRNGESMHFDEEYNNKYRNISIVLFVFFQLMLLFTMQILRIINSQFLIENANFICYSILFIIFFIMYRKIIVNSIRKIDIKKF